MDHSFSPTQWKDRDTNRQVSKGQGHFDLVTELPPMRLADRSFISGCGWDAALRYAAHSSGFDDYEIADDIPVSHSYMSKILKGTAGLHGNKLVTFMRRTRSLAPLQWLAEQMGAEIVLKDSQAQRIAALEAELKQLTGGH
jgi:hypothetical protein